MAGTTSNSIEATIVTELQEIRVVGVVAEVEKEGVAETMAELWRRAGAAGALTPEPHDTAGAVAYAVYHDHADRLGNRYRVLIGTASERPPGADEAAITVPAGTYGRLHLDGSGPEVVQRLWRFAWTRWSERGRRRFEVDVERHPLDGGGGTDLLLGLSEAGDERS